MKTESEKRRMDVHTAGARLDAAMIDGIAVTDLLAFCRAGRGAVSA